MKRVLCIFAAVSLLTGLCWAQEQQNDDFVSSQDRIVFVEMERVFNGFYKTQLAQSQMELQKEEIDVERESMGAEMKEINDEVDALREALRDKSLADDVRSAKSALYEKRLVDLREKREEIQAYTERRNKQLQLQVSRMGQRIMDEIRQTVVDYAKNNGLMAVIDSSKRNQALGVILYTHNNVDVTQRILDILNKNQPSEQE